MAFLYKGFFKGAVKMRDVIVCRTSRKEKDQQGHFISKAGFQLPDFSVTFYMFAIYYFNQLKLVIVSNFYPLLMGPFTEKKKKKGGGGERERRDS